MTSDGIDRLDAELEELITVKRREASAAIGEAREQGGEIGENTEYHSAKELQAQIELKIAQLTDLRSKVELMNFKKLKSKSINIGALVTVINEDTGEKIKYRIVSGYEASLENGFISNTSPLGRALIGKTVKDSIDVKAPSGDKYYQITKIEYK